MRFIGIFSDCCTTNNLTELDYNDETYQCKTCKRIFIKAKDGEDDQSLLSRILKRFLDDVVRRFF